MFGTEAALLAAVVDQAIAATVPVIHSPQSPPGVSGS